MLVLEFLGLLFNFITLQVDLSGKYSIHDRLFLTDHLLFADLINEFASLTLIQSQGLHLRRSDQPPPLINFTH
jgi:hypothetical protein